MYGGEGQKGARSDPRSGRVRQEAMLRRRQGPPPWALIGLAIAVVAAGLVILVLVLSGGEDGADTTLGEPDPAALFGRLDCTPGVVVTEPVAGEGRNLREIMQSLEPGVAMVSQDPMTSGKWWGYDAAEKVVAALLEADTPDEYTAYLCGG